MTWDSEFIRTPPSYFCRFQQRALLYLFISAAGGRRVNTCINSPVPMIKKHLMAQVSQQPTDFYDVHIGASDQEKEAAQKTDLFFRSRVFSALKVA